MRLLALATLAAAGCAPGPAAAPPVPAPAPPRETVENPHYTAWARFKPGTAVTQRTTTTEDGNPAATVTTTTYTLAEVTDTFLVVEMQASTKRFDGTEAVNPPEKLRTERRIAPPPGPAAAGTPPAGDRGAETVTAAGVAYETAWLKTRSANEAGDVFGQTWTSDAVPGRLVKSVATTPAVKKRVVVELVAVRLP